MKILALSDWFPYPPDNGARMRIHNLLRQLAQWHEIVLLSFTREPPSVQDMDAVQAYCREVRTVPFRHYHPHRLKAVLGLFQPRPRSVIDTYSPEMEKLVRKKQGEESFDAVVAFAIGPSGGIASYVQEMRGMPRVVEDLELTIIKDRIDIQPHWYQQLRLRLTWWKLRNYTTRLLRDIDGYTVASVKERDLLLSILPNCQLQAVIPNGVDLALYNGDFGPTEPDSLVFPGALTYEANLGAIKLFLAKVFPIVKTRCPGVKLYITGRTDGVRLQDLPSHNGVVLTGYLDDIRPRVSCSSVCVVPMTVGGGTRLKVLEAMALGTPVVSTNKGAEGLEVAAEQNILIADEPTEFANAILRLLDDPALRAKLAANGQKLVHEQYSWERIGEDLDRFLHQVLSEHKLQGAA